MAPGIIESNRYLIHVNSRCALQDCGIRMKQTPTVVEQAPFSWIYKHGSKEIIELADALAKEVERIELESRVVDDAEAADRKELQAKLMHEIRLVRIYCVLHRLY